MHVAQKGTEFEAGGLRLNSECCPARVPGGAEELTILERTQEVVPEVPS